MRQIKFRAWDKITKTMYNVRELEWADGEILTAYIGLHTSEPENIELMQFTSLYDKNGKEIYEGDIVKGPSYQGNGEVKFGYFMTEGADVYSGFCRAGWYIKWPGDDDQTEDLDLKCEVIGNIYENPELLQ